MRIAVHLRGGPNSTNIRSECIARGFEALGHSVAFYSRGEPSFSDLYVQTGFNASAGLRNQIDKGLPYLIMEAGPFRSWTDIQRVSSFGFNGLAGGATRPAPPSRSRFYPLVEPMKTEGGILIIGQKPTDHSLRGSDHVQWILDKAEEYPEATFRHHPLMHAGKGTLASLLKEARKVVTYTSTSAVEAAVAGCEVQVDGHGSWWSPQEGEEREETLHRLSWAAFNHSEYENPEIAQYVLQGYDEAFERARQGQVEIPREKVNGKAVCERYYRLVV